MSEDEDLELKRLRLKKMQEILHAKTVAEAQKNQHVPTLAEKIDQLMNVLLEQSALQYLNEIKQKNIQAYNMIRNELFPAEIISEIDLLLNYLRQGMIRRGIISLTEIQQLERRALGIGPSITIKKQGEDAKSLTSFLKDDD